MFQRAVTALFYLRLEALDQDGDQQVEEDVVAEGHERDEVQGGHRGGGGHAVVEHLVPVLLGQDLGGKAHRRESIHWKTHINNEQLLRRFD